jgi:hypothetical protein
VVKKENRLGNQFKNCLKLNLEEKELTEVEKEEKKLEEERRLFMEEKKQFEDEERKLQEEKETLQNEKIKKLEQEKFNEEKKKKIEEEREIFKEEQRLFNEEKLRKLEERKLEEEKLRIEQEVKSDEKNYHSTFYQLVDDSKTNEEAKTHLVTLIEDYGFTQNDEETTKVLELLHQRDQSIFEKLKGLMKEDLPKFKFCTSKFGSKLLQKPFKCQTCNKEEEKNLCGLCIKNCHEGHDTIQSEEYIWMLCDCVRIQI